MGRRAMPVCAQGIQRSTWAAWYSNGSSPLGRGCWRLEGGAPASEADGRAALSSEHTVVIGGGRDPGGAGGARRPSNVDRSITAVDHPAIAASPYRSPKAWFADPTALLG